MFNCGSKHSKGQCKTVGHVCRNCGRSHHFESVCMSKSEKSSPNKQSQQKPKYDYLNKHSSYTHYGKMSVYKHKKISSVKDNEQSHYEDEYYFVNTIQMRRLTILV